MNRVEPVRNWPGVKKGAGRSRLHRVERVAKVSERREGNRMVTVRVGGQALSLFADTGCKNTIITPRQYKQCMGEVEAVDTRLRAWGSKTYLDIKGMIETTLVAGGGAKTRSKVYIVDGYKPEGLLGDTDAEELGIIAFNGDGKKVEDVRLMVADLRKAGINVKTDRPRVKEATEGEMAETMRIVNDYKGSSITDRIGKVKTEPIKLEYRANFQPIQPP